MHQSKVPDEQTLRKVATTQAKIQTLQQEHKELAERIRIAIGSQCSAEAVADVLNEHDDDRLVEYWERLLTRLQDAQSRLSQLHESRGETIQEMKTLAEDRRLPKAKLDLSCIDEKIRRTVSRWRQLAVTSLMLEAIRQIYETERQPETLAEASGYLNRLTEGRYQRVWTPLSEDNLRVDDSDGQSLPLDVLSQGTREAVFLSLRMALSAAYARRGAVLPLVLDDVLVNFDTRRARRAAEALQDFAASGHQLLLFTCHQHIMRIFEMAEAEVRTLPAREGVVDEELFLLAQEPEAEILEPEIVEEDEEYEEEIEEEPEEELEEEYEEVEEVEEPVEEVEEEIVDEPEPEPVLELPEVDDEQLDEEALEPPRWDEDDELKLAQEDPAAPLHAGSADLPFGRWWESKREDDAA
jgi:hypothetical protein